MPVVPCCVWGGEGEGGREGGEVGGGEGFVPCFAGCGVVEGAWLVRVGGVAAPELAEADLEEELGERAGRVGVAGLPFVQFGRWVG